MKTIIQRKTCVAVFAGASVLLTSGLICVAFSNDPVRTFFDPKWALPLLLSGILPFVVLERFFKPTFLGNFLVSISIYGAALFIFTVTQKLLISSGTFWEALSGIYSLGALFSPVIVPITMFAAMLSVKTINKLRV